MLGDVLRTPQFKYVFSVLIGISLVIVIFRPYCKGDNCNIWKAPPPTEVRDAVFQIGQKCYTFKEKSSECKAEEAYIEGFRGEFSCRQVPVGPLKATPSGPYGPTYLPPEGLLKDSLIPENFNWTDAKGHRTDASCNTSKSE